MDGDLAGLDGGFIADGAGAVHQGLGRSAEGGGLTDLGGGAEGDVHGVGEDAGFLDGGLGGLLEGAGAGVLVVFQFELQGAEGVGAGFDGGVDDWADLGQVGDGGADGVAGAIADDPGFSALAGALVFVDGIQLQLGGLDVLVGDAGFLDGVDNLLHELVDLFLGGLGVVGLGGDAELKDGEVGSGLHFGFADDGEVAGGVVGGAGEDAARKDEQWHEHRSQHENLLWFRVAVGCLDAREAFWFQGVAFSEAGGYRNVNR